MLRSLSQNDGNDERNMPFYNRLIILRHNGTYAVIYQKNTKEKAHKQGRYKSKTYIDFDTNPTTLMQYCSQIFRTILL